MFGHQDEPQKPADPSVAAPATDTLANTTSLDAPAAASSFNPAEPPTSMVAPLLDSQDSPSTEPAPAPSLTLPSTAQATDTNTLLDIKQHALQQLSPLVGHLDQSPEEKFRTTMMMIQAADNQDLISSAYEAAQAITDEKARAQALLDIVNEINYFTTQHPGK